MKENNEHGVGEKDLVKLNLLGGVLAEGKNARRCWLGLLLGCRDGVWLLCYIMLYDTPVAGHNLMHVIIVQDATLYH